MARDELLESPPPGVSADEATAILGTIYGIEGEVIPLRGERDRNFLVESNEGRFVLKIVNPAESPSTVDMQQRVLQHVKRWDPRLPVPQPVATKAGELWTVIADHGFPVRLITYLPGTPIEEAGYPPQLRKSTAVTLARLDLALATFTHPALDRPLLWDLTRILELRPRLTHLDPDRLRLIESWLRHFEAGVLPRLGGLRQQPIHGDFNPANLIVAPDRPHELAGIIDFGDMTRGPLAAEVAIAAAYQSLEEGDPTAIIAHCTAAYHQELPLAPDEAAIVADLAISRLVQSLVISAWRAARHPDNRDYILIHADRVWATLQNLTQADLYELRDKVGSACRVPPAPAPRTAASLQRRHTRLGPGLRLTYDEPLHVAAAEGVWIIDTAGKRYLDAYNNVPHVGHSQPDVVAALSRQAARLNTNTRYLVDDVIAYADRLAALFPDPLEVVYFANSGSEANDLAWRMARTVTGRRGMIVTEHAYHGSTYLTMATSPEELGIGNLESWVATVPPPRSGVDPSKRLGNAVQHLTAVGESPAAFACDTVFSSDGIFEPPPGYLVATYQAVREAGGLCIADEIQAGFGRVGTRMWGFAGHGVVPDIVTLGKPMGNGHPLAAVVTTRAIADEFTRNGYYFSTFAGNPVSTAAGTAVLDVMERQQLPEQADRVGSYLRDGLSQLASSHSGVGSVRGPGMFIGVEIVDVRGSPDAEFAEHLQNRLRHEGVLIGRTGPHGNVLKIRPPLVFKEEHADLLLAALHKIWAES